MNGGGRGKQLVGIVSSNKMDKTVVVKVERITIHPLYGKRIKKHKKFMANDPENQCNIGDKVLIQESRPLSKNKKWELLEILERKLI